MEIEFLFIYRLHTPPDVLDNMFWYDIQMLYKRWIKQMEEERDAQEEESSIQAQQMEEYRNAYSVPEMPKMPDVGQLTRGFGNSLSSLGINI